MVLDAASSEVSRLRHFNECFVQGLITFFRSITDDSFYPSRIEFEHQREHGQEHVIDVLGCDVIFGAKENRLYFPATLLSHASPHAEPELLDLHDGLPVSRWPVLRRKTSSDRSSGLLRNCWTAARLLWMQWPNVLALNPEPCVPA